MSATVYRFHAVDGALLYVGATLTATERISHHSSRAHWFSEVASATFQHFPTWAEAHAVELAAITNESPRYNINGADATHRMAAREAVRQVSRYEPNVRLTTIRERSGLSKTALADRAGVDRTLVHRIENGERNATPTVIRKFADALGVPLMALIGPAPDEVAA